MVGAVPAVEGPDGSEGPHVFVTDLNAPELEDADRHHLTKVLRLRPGDVFTVADGAGGWRRCRFGAAVEADGEVHRLGRPSPVLTVGFALVKGGRNELIVQKLTELGIDVIQPFVAERSVVRWDPAKAAASQPRLTRVAQEASSQSRRVFLPEVAPARDFEAVAAPSGVVRAERGGPPAERDLTSILVGPEGGWSAAEQRLLPATVGIGPHVLRAETAAIAVGVVLAGLRFGSLSVGPGRPSEPR